MLHGRIPDRHAALQPGLRLLQPAASTPTTTSAAGVASGSDDPAASSVLQPGSSAAPLPAGSSVPLPSCSSHVAPLHLPGCSSPGLFTAAADVWLERSWQAQEWRQ